MTTIFAKIIKGEIPADKVFENDRIVAFKDIAPVAPIHILIVPKKEITCLQAMQKEDFPLLGEIVAVAQQLAKKFNIEEGYRLVVNNGEGVGQTIFHLHFHLIGGKTIHHLI